MLFDLQTNYLRRGTIQAEILRLLGPADRQLSADEVSGTRQEESKVVYYELDRGGAFDTASLVITFDETGRLVRSFLFEN